MTVFAFPIFVTIRYLLAALMLAPQRQHTLVTALKQTISIQTTVQRSRLFETPFTHRTSIATIVNSSAQVIMPAAQCHLGIVIFEKLKVLNCVTLALGSERVDGRFRNKLIP